jgi:hypothetical protein
LLLTTATAVPAPAWAAKQPDIDANPCVGPQAPELRCPDLVMERPFGLYTDRITKPGRVLLRAGNSIDSIGKGPAELLGIRTGPRWMRTRQRIYRRDGTRMGINTGARLQFKFAHLASYWWKFFNEAKFELWRLDSIGRPTVRVRTGPKVAYCLRDLGHSRALLPRSPLLPHYPACSRNAGAHNVTLGTSVGWSDIYPPSYPEQWIDITGLRGCFAYIHVADPKNGIYESNEKNNVAQLIVRLPFKPDARRKGCRGRDYGHRHGPTSYP